MAPPRRPGLTIVSRKAPAGDTAVALILTAVPVEHCTAAMLAFRAGAEAMRVPDDAVVGHEGMPISNHPANPTMQHWQAGGVVVFGYTAAGAVGHARRLLERVYITEAGGVAVRRSR